MILYYSGTGNSRRAARILHGALCDTLFSINDALRKGENTTLDSDEPLVFVTPTYCWNLPNVVRNFVRNAEFSGDARAYFVLTCGDDVGNAARKAEKLCVEKGLTFMGLSGVVMPENYVTLFNAPDKAAADEIVARAQPKTLELAPYIKNGLPFPRPRIALMDRLKSSAALSRAFYAIFITAKKYRSTDACTGCGRCAALCPLSNITMENGRPNWGKRCTQCMACICACPCTAIEYGRKTAGKTRYYLEDKPS